MSKKGMRRVEMTEDEYNKYMQLKERARKDQLYSQLITRIRQQGHSGKGWPDMLQDIFPTSVLEFILQEWNPVPPTPPIPPAVRAGMVPFVEERRD